MRPSLSIGAWWTWCSSMKTSASASVASAPIVRTGRLATAPAGGVGAASLGQHAAAQVAVGQEAGRLPAHDDGARALLAHEACRLADRRRGVDLDRRRDRQRADRRAELGGDRQRLERGGAAQARPQLEDERLRERARLHQPFEHVGRQLVEQRVLRRDHVRVRARAADERREAERLALLEYLEEASVALEAQLSLPHDVEERGRRPALAQHARAAGRVGDLERVLDGAQRLRVEPAPRRVRPQELERLHPVTFSPMSGEWLTTFAAEEARLLGDLEALVRIESPSHDAAAVSRLAAFVEEKLRAAGVKAERRACPPAGDAIVASIGTGDGSTLLLGHLDTVWPVGSFGAHRWHRDGDRASRPRRLRHEGRDRGGDDRACAC